MKLIAVVLGLLLAQDKRVAVPEEAALKEAEKTVRELFKDDLAKKTAADRRTLARKLLTQGRDAGNTPASQYALLTLAVDQAAQAPDVETALLAMTELAALFTIDVVAQRSSSLATLTKAVKTPEDVKAVAKAYLQLADEAMKGDAYDDAAKAAAEAGSQARRAKELSLVNIADAKTKEVAARKVRFEKVRKAKDLLATMPDDPAANLAVGQFYCFSKGDWTAGVACLVKSPDGPLKAVALKDAAKPETPEEQAAVGDGWWDVSETAPAEDKTTIRDRAGSWYQQALPKIAGLGKVKVEKRLIQWNTERAARGTWVDFTDPSAFGLKGRPGDVLEVVNTNKNSALTTATSKFLPPGEFDGWTLRLRFKMDEPGVSLNYKGAGAPLGFAFFLSGKSRTIQFPGEKGPNGPVQILPIATADEYVVAVLHVKDDDVVFLNGVEMGRFSNPADHFESLAFNCRTGTTLVDKIRLRKR